MSYGWNKLNLVHCCMLPLSLREQVAMLWAPGLAFGTVFLLLPRGVAHDGGGDSFPSFPPRHKQRNFAYLNPPFPTQHRIQPGTMFSSFTWVVVMGALGAFGFGWGTGANDVVCMGGWVGGCGWGNAHTKAHPFNQPTPTPTPFTHRVMPLGPRWAPRP